MESVATPPGNWALLEPNPANTPVADVQQIKESLAWAQRTTTAHLQVVQAHQKQEYDRQAVICTFQEGDHVLTRALLFP